MLGNALVHLVRYLLSIEAAHSQTIEAERKLLLKYCKGLSSAVEIGVFEGVNTVLIAKALSSNGILYGIDPFIKGKLGMCYYKLIAKNEIKKSGVQKKVKLIPSFSQDALGKVPDKVDFIFVDGDHSYNGMRQDWRDWTKKLNKNGIIALHDTAIPAHDPSVANLGSYKYFNEAIIFDKDFEIVESIGSLNVLRRIKNSN